MLAWHVSQRRSTKNRRHTSYRNSFRSISASSQFTGSWTQCRIHLHPVQEVTKVLQVIHSYRGTRECLRDQVGVDPLDDYIVIQVLSRDMLKGIRDICFIFVSPPGTSTIFYCQWPINEIRICEPTLFHAAGLPLDDQPGSSRAAPQTPNPAPHGTCMIKVLVSGRVYVLCIPVSVYLLVCITGPVMHSWPTTWYYQGLALCNWWSWPWTPTNLRYTQRCIQRAATCEQIRTSSVFSISLCVFLGGKSIRSIKIHQLHPISYPCNDPSSYHPKELRNYENASNLPETLSRLSCRSNWSNAVHTCPHTSRRPCKPSMHNINAVYPFIEG